MSLQLIKGALNSGRTGEIRALVAERVRSGPLVVAPTADARYELEAELCGDCGASIGPLVTGFLELAEGGAAATGTTTLPLASVSQRRHLVSMATARSPLRILAESATRPGFTTALEKLFAELRAAGVKPQQTATTDRYLDEILSLYEAYLEELDRAGLTDQSGLTYAAAAALKASPDSWDSRPVFMHGFDDLSLDQLRLVEALAAANEVTISLTYEDREALRARSRLLGQLEERGGLVLRQMPPVPRYTPNPLLFYLERNFGEPQPLPPVPDEEGLNLMLTAGRRGEAEAVAVEIKQLLVAGTPASRIAIALRTPNQSGPGLARALYAAGIPVALETEIGVTATATGQALADLAAAALDKDGAEALVRLVRGAGITTISPDVADELEWTVRRRRLRTTDEALAALERNRGARLPEIEQFRQAASAGVRELADRVSDFVNKTAENVSGDLELRTARLIATTAVELVALVRRPPELLQSLLAAEVRTWSGPIGERVRIASPYTLRTTRFDHLFVCSLQEGEFPRRGADGPFLSEDQRAELGLPERADTEAEEMYLFQVCLSLPKHGLWLSARTADADGSVEQPSPFLAQVETLAADAARRHSFDLGDVAPPPERATSEQELGRALLLADRPGAFQPLSDPIAATRVANRIELAKERRRLASRPRPLRQAAVLDELGGRLDFGATSLESFLRYPYHWFIGHELRPEPLDRNDEHLVDGSLAHTVLQELYSDPPGQTTLPTTANLGAWRDRCEALLERSARTSGLSARFVADRIRLRRLSGFLKAFIAQEAEEAELGVEPAMLEASFGRDDDGPPPLQQDGWRLRGTIDRVDLTADRGHGLLQDYKYSARSRGLSDFERDGILQVPLYLAALNELWAVKPLGGLYRPLRAGRDKVARGMLTTAAVNGPLAGMRYSNRDLVDEPEMMLLIEEALAQSGEIVAAIRTGTIDREPLPEAFTDVPGWAAIDRRVRNLDDEGEQ